jgi:hypothetical protein
MIGKPSVCRDHQFAHRIPLISLAAEKSAQGLLGVVGGQ